FYQAKSIRQTANQLAAEELESMLSLVGANAPSEIVRGIASKIAAYRTTVARYESEPDPHAPDDALRGEGKRQLRARAEHLMHLRDVYQTKDRNFDFAV